MGQLAFPPRWTPNACTLLDVACPAVTCPHSNFDAKKKISCSPSLEYFGDSEQEVSHSRVFTHAADIRRFSTSDRLASVCDATERWEGARLAAGGAESQLESAQFITLDLRDHVFLEPVRSDSSRFVAVAVQLLWGLLWGSVIKSERKRHQCSPILLLQKESWDGNACAK